MTLYRIRVRNILMKDSRKIRVFILCHPIGVSISTFHKFELCIESDMSVCVFLIHENKNYRAKYALLWFRLVVLELASLALLAMTRKKNLLIESQHDACFLHALARSIALEPIYSFIWSAIRSPCVWIFFHSLYSFASLLTLGIEIEIYLFVSLCQCHFCAHCQRIGTCFINFFTLIETWPRREYFFSVVVVAARYSVWPMHIEFGRLMLSATVFPATFFIHTLLWLIRLVSFSLFFTSLSTNFFGFMAAHHSTVLHKY